MDAASGHFSSRGPVKGGKGLVNKAKGCECELGLECGPIYKEAKGKLVGKRVGNFAASINQ